MKNNTVKNFKKTVTALVLCGICAAVVPAPARAEFNFSKVEIAADTLSLGADAAGNLRGRKRSQDHGSP